ncbi:MAG: hypothetical protein ACM3WS_05635 [Bacillota bacterium]
MQAKHFGFFVLSILSAASVLARPSGDGRPERAIFQNAALERNLQGGEQPEQRQPEARRGRYVVLPETSGYTAQGDSASSAQENGRRQGRMSPEERRTLRRQIDEVGHDIYAPKR